MRRSGMVSHDAVLTQHGCCKASSSGLRRTHSLLNFYDAQHCTDSAAHVMRRGQLLQSGSCAGTSMLCVHTCVTFVAEQGAAGGSEGGAERGHDGGAASAAARRALGLASAADAGDGRRSRQ